MPLFLDHQAGTFGFQKNKEQPFLFQGRFGDQEELGISFVRMKIEL